MGSVYAQIISQNPSPKVALLSNGEEPKKGAPEVVEAHRLLASQNAIYFVGNVEGVDIPKGSADVIVCEGFLGNVVLKMIEGVGEIAGAMIRSAKIKVEEAEEDVMYEPLYDQVRRFAKLTDWRHYGGAPILGLDRVVIKAHGRSTSRAIRNAIKLAARAADGGMIEKIRQGMEAILS
jgi:glycerol-3-phosphate acyltransferase PlsX